MEEIDKIQEIWQQTKETDIISQIIAVKDEIKNTPLGVGNVDALVDKVFTLTVIMDNLSEIKEYATLKAELAEEEYDQKVNGTYLELKNGPEKISDSSAKATAEIECYELKKKEISTRYISRLVNDLYKDCERVINFTQTRVKSVVDSKIRSNLN